MPEDEGWYWCVADAFQSGLFVKIARLLPTIVSTVQAAPPTIQPTTLKTTLPTTQPSTEDPVIFVPLAKMGNADQLSVYQTYHSKWSDYQVIILVKHYVLQTPWLSSS